jgi:hypothetical protein
MLYMYPTEKQMLLLNRLLVVLVMQRDAGTIVHTLPLTLSLSFFFFSSSSSSSGSGSF